MSSVLVFNLIIQRDAPDLGESMIDTAQIGLTVIVEPDWPGPMLVWADKLLIVVIVESDQLKVSFLSFISLF